MYIFSYIMYQHEQANIIKNTEDPMMCNDWTTIDDVYTRSNFRIFGMWSNSHRNNIPIIQDMSHLPFLKSFASNNKIFNMVYSRYVTSIIIIYFSIYYKLRI